MSLVGQFGTLTNPNSAWKHVKTLISWPGTPWHKASDRPALIYLGGIIAYKTFNLYSEVKKYYNSKIKIDSDSNLSKQK